MGKCRITFFFRDILICFQETYFESYSDYSIGQDDAIATYNKLVESNDKFRDLNERLHFFHRISWGTNKLKFEDYLIMVKKKTKIYSYPTPKPFLIHKHSHFNDYFVTSYFSRH